MSVTINDFQVVANEISPDQPRQQQENEEAQNTLHPQDVVRIIAKQEERLLRLYAH
jgi:hypothetical protein